MSFKLMITTAVYNEDGNVVNLAHRGEKPFLARTQVVLQEFVHVENAHAELNKVHALVRNLRAIMSDNMAVDEFPSVNRSEGEGG
jgi:hypothetical protein